VSAKDLGTGREQKITIQGSSGLSKDEVEKMTKEAELNAEADKNRREQIEARNQLESVIYQLEKTVKDAGDKFPAEMKSKIEAGLVSARKDLESNDAARMRAASENLTKLGGEIYAQAQQATAAAGAGAAPGGASSPQDEKKTGEKKADVVDADFEVVDESNKKS
jgi:molecular chaperone DnaK